jgi:hypothetical protein
MIIEGNMLIGLLIAMALAIAALVVFIRFAVKKEPSDADSLFGRLLRFGEKDGQDEAQDAANAGTATVSEDGLGGLSLPAPGSGKAAGEEPAKKAPFSVSLGGLFSGVLSSKKSKEKIKEEVRAIDDQLNSVLHETEEINVLGLPPQISADDSPLSDGRGMRELDLEMGALQGPLEIVGPEDFKLEPPALDAAPAAPAAAPLKPEEPVKAEQKKPDTPPAPVEAEAQKSPVDFMANDKKGAGDDLLDDLESSSKHEEAIDMSIMKEYLDMPITCVEIESDLKGILDQITINGQNRRSPGR